MLGMYSDAVIHHALNLERAGSFDSPSACGEAGNTACGDHVRIEFALAEGRITAARHRSFGCPHATAAAAVLCALVEDRTPVAAATIGLPDVEATLGADADRRECLLVAVDALCACVARAVEAVPAPTLDPRRVAVAMSGGVDSAVALLKVREAGFEPVGVTLRLWIDPSAPDSERACCSPQSVRAARAACHALGVPHVGLDLREGFKRTVVDEFVTEYGAGRTPNPCVRCNSSFRFDALAGFADRVGAARVATGHYARIVHRDGRALVARAIDANKDQSYMLARVPAAILARTWFPLGEQTKPETREQARAAGLDAAGRAESQEVCFVGGGDHREFVERYGGAGRAGEVVEADGHVVGRHAGIHRFTPGQRRGVGVAANTPIYVIRTEPASGRVVVGPRAALERSSLRVSPGALDVTAGDRVQAKLRYRSDPVWATVRRDESGFELELDDPAVGIAPGQTAVLYQGDVVVGAGTIA
jgi:tRNA-specific 2-thiouridylase